MKQLLNIAFLFISITFSFAQTTIARGVKEITVDFPAPARILSCGSGLVYKPKDYVYSSAIDYAGQKGLVDDVVVFRMYGI